jgi:predicted Rossmann-fold nucleotide-binding protein
MSGNQNRFSGVRFLLDPDRATPGTLRIVKEFEDLETFEAALPRDAIAGAVLQGLDLSRHGLHLSTVNVAGSVFLGCRLPPEVMADLTLRGALVFPNLPGDLPFRPYRPTLYTAGELFEAFDPADPGSYCRCLDARVYRHWEAAGRGNPGSILETLARRLHDHAITDALEELLRDHGRVVAIMGGHSMSREAPSYRAVAQMSRTLTRKGYFLASGGGPGAMEATHLGAWFAPYDDDDLEAAIAILSEAPTYRDLRWLAQAFRVLDRWGPRGDGQRSLGIPTWFYGHEPPNPFATHIAKYFENSVREDGLVTIATHGIVFAPGSAGTIQEIFQDATQNHYGTFGLVSPMVFFQKSYWMEEKPVYPLLRDLAEGRPYAGLLTVEDDPDGIVRFLEHHPPVPCEEGGWSFCRAFGLS